MKKLLLVLIGVAIVGCSKDEKPTALYMYGKAETFKIQQQRAYGASYAMEVSLFRDGNDVKVFTGQSNTQRQYLSSLGEDGRDFVGFELIGTDWLFNYVMKHDGVYYNFTNKPDGIYMMKSLDLYNWTYMNGNAPVLSKSSDPNSIYYFVWNVAVAVDDTGTWHILAESSNSTPEQRAVGLAYSSGVLVGDNLDFDTNKSVVHAIPHGGNPHLEFIPGKGLLAFHGQLLDPIEEYKLGIEWYTTISTLSIGDTEFVTHHDFAIGTPGVHICDPSIVNLVGGGSLLSVSYDQEYAYLLRSDLTIEEIFDLGVQ